MLMSLFVFAPLIASLVICLIPLWLLARKADTHAQDFFISSEFTPASVIQNSSIAYAVRASSFVPFFAWGATGDVLPAILSAVSLGLGVCLLYLLRRPIVGFLERARKCNGSMTVHAFIARQHGDDARVRLLASGLSIFALLGLLVGEAFGVAILLKSFLPQSQETTFALVLGMLILTAVYTLVAGNSGAMRSAQSHLGFLYFGLFGSTAFLLYLQVSALTPMPPHGTVALAVVACCCAAMIYYRRSRYVDTGLVSIAHASAAIGDKIYHESAGARRFRRLEKILNASISGLAVLVITIALMKLYSEGLSVIAHDIAAALQPGTSIPPVGLIALVLLFLIHPLVDFANWHRIAVCEKDCGAGGGAIEGSAAFRSIFRIYAVESLLLGLFMCMFGAIAGAALGLAPGFNAAQVFLQELTAQQNLVASLAASFFLVAIVPMALSTMTAAFSATLCAIRYDIVPTFWPELAAEKIPAAAEATARRRTILIGGGLCLLMLVLFYLAFAGLEPNLTKHEVSGPAVFVLLRSVVVGAARAWTDAPSMDGRPRPHEAEMGSRCCRIERCGRGGRHGCLPCDRQRAVAVGRGSGLSGHRLSPSSPCVDLAGRRIRRFQRDKRVTRSESFRPVCDPEIQRLGAIRRLRHAFHDAEVSDGAVAQKLERGLVAFAVMGGDGAVDAVELDDDDALGEALLVGLGGRAASQEAAAGGADRRRGKLGIGGQGVRIRDRLIASNPVRLRHCALHCG